MSARTPRPVPSLSLPARLRAAPPAVRRTLERRIGLVVATLSGEAAPPDRTALLARFAELLGPAEPSAVWLALAVLEGELPTVPDVRRTTRAIRLAGVPAAFGTEPEQIARGWLAGVRHQVEVEIVSGAVLVDVEHTARTDLATGIQRVARETVRRWDRDHDPVLVGWAGGHRRLRRLSEAERRTALHGGAGRDDVPAGGTALIPWQATYLLPELAPERPRNERVAALAQFARCRTGVIGFDCVPITTAETTVVGVSEAFALNLSAVRYMDRVSAISRAAAAEYAGWRSMLGSVGIEGPEISVDVLPAEVPESTAADLAAVRERFGVGEHPLVLCVGTHEPRKNHLALLHAAELLWREGLRFSLVLVGGRSWNDDGFRRAVDAARARNRPVQAVTTVSDRELWAAYRIARCTVFPSLNEGFGLPVAESLACGTPAVTSRHGSMAEIAADGGAVLVDPRDDHDLASGLRTLLTDDATEADLRAAARSRPRRTWDDYARDVWGALAG